MSSSLVAATDTHSSNLSLRNRHEPSSSSILAAPVMLLSGHQSEVFNGQFSPSGAYLTTCGGDGLYIWNVSSHEIQGHHMATTTSGKGGSAAILDTLYLSNESLVSGGPDGHIRVWDTHTGHLVKTCHGSQAEEESLAHGSPSWPTESRGTRRWQRPAAHHAAVNCLHRLSENVFLSGSNDHLLRVWDTRYKRQVWTVKHAFPVTALASSHSSHLIYSSGTTPDVSSWDLRTFSMTAAARQNEPSPTATLYSAHSDTVSCLKLDPSSGTRLSSWSFDGHMNIYSVVDTITIMSRWKGPAYGHHDSTSLLRHAVHPTSGASLAVPSADRSIYLLDSLTGQKMDNTASSVLSPGHRGTINAVAWHPTLPLLASVGVDRQVFLMELAPLPM